MKSKRYLIVGAGFSGAVLARQLVEESECAVLVVDSRDHVAGNCYTERDGSSEVMIHRYGPHIFHTDREDVWKYLSQWVEMRPFINRVKAHTPNGVFGMPINLHTINQFFGKQLSPREARQFVFSLGDNRIENPQNFEEQALKFLGEGLYREFFYGYTKKQWGCEPKELPASILKRLPVRFNYDDNYYAHRYQGIPAEGYTAAVERLLSHSSIEVKLATNFERNMKAEFDHVFYTGSLDGYFDYRAGRLGYRTVFWDRIDDAGDYQGNAVINYPDIKVAHTRIHEHKWFAPWEEHDRTVAFVEFAKETESADIPYYPKRLAGDIALLKRYEKLAREEEAMSFLGRLATYRYMDMDQVIGEALDFSTRFLHATANALKLPLFPWD